MWHHQVETTTILPATGVSSSPSKSSSTCSSSSSQIPTNPSLTKKSMEEVRKDTSLASLCCVHSNTNTITTNPSHPNFRGMIFQDFLASPPTRGASNTESSSALDSTFFGSLTPPPATMLSLNSGSDFQNLENGVHVRSNPQLHSHASVGTTSVGSSLNHTFVDVLGSSSVFPSFCKEMPQENNKNSGGPRHKRMIKNRESAARSRARKQAYTDELELEVAHLLEENAKLRRQREKLMPAFQKGILSLDPQQLRFEKYIFIKPLYGKVEKKKENVHPKVAGPMIFVFFPDVESLKKNVIKSLVNTMKTEKVTRAIVVTQQDKPIIIRINGFTGQLEEFYVELFQEKQLLVNVTENALVPKHQLLSDEAKKKLLKTHSITELQLPRIRLSDPIARHYGGKGRAGYDDHPAK